MFLKNPTLRILLVVLIALALSLSAVSPRPVQAAGAVAACNEASFVAAVTGGGTVTFSCSGTINLTAPITISADTVIDGSGQKVTISGGGVTRLFTVNQNINFTVINMTLIQGVTTGSNHLTSFGSAIHNSGILTIERSLFANNTTEGRGGAIFNNGGTVTITNSTFYNNTATGNASVYLGVGGAIENDNGTLTVINSTFSGNAASAGGAIYTRSWSSTVNTTNTFKGTIITNSTGDNCASAVVGTSKPIVTNDEGGNINFGVTDATCPGNNVDPKLNALADNGGSTRTFALQVVSPAIDAVTSGCTTLAVDQRGVTRSTPNCDSGSFEYRVPSSTIIVTITRTDSAGLSYGNSHTFNVSVMDGTNPVTSGKVTLYASGLPIGSGNVSGSGVAILTTTKIPGGTHMITAAWEGTNTTERVTGTMAGTLTITKAPLTVNAPDPTINYGQADSNFSPTYTGFVLGESASYIDTPPTCTPGGSTPRNVGQYTITCTGGLDDSYSFNLTDTGTLTINKATLSVTANAQTKTYGQTDPVFDFTYSSFQYSDTESMLDVKPTCTVSGAHQNVNTYPITCSGGSDNNYTFTYTGANLVVNKAALTIKADNLLREVNTPNPTLTYTVTGLAYSDTLASIGVTPTLSTTAVQSSPVDIYPITITGPASTTNYNITYQNGTLNVNDGYPYKMYAPAITNQ